MKPQIPTKPHKSPSANLSITPLQTHQPLLFSHQPNLFLPQGLYTCCSHYLVSSSLTYMASDASLPSGLGPDVTSSNTP